MKADSHETFAERMQRRRVDPAEHEALERMRSQVWPHPWELGERNEREMKCVRSDGRLDMARRVLVELSTGCWDGGYTLPPPQELRYLAGTHQIQLTWDLDGKHPETFVPAVWRLRLRWQLDTAPVVYRRGGKVVGRLPFGELSRRLKVDCNRLGTWTVLAVYQSDVVWWKALAVATRQLNASARLAEMGA